jgi:hypothetical protein
MNEFTQSIKNWETFYLLTGTAAATLIGLLFVAISINIEVFRRRVTYGLAHFAALTFNCYFYVLLIAILFVVPGLSPLALGLPLLILGLLGLVNAILQQRRARIYRLDHQGGSLAARFNVPIAGFAGLALMGVGVALGIKASLYGIVIVIILLLGSASQNAWSLLIVSDVTREDESQGEE